MLSLTYTHTTHRAEPPKSGEADKEGEQVQEEAEGVRLADFLEAMLAAAQVLCVYVCAVGFVCICVVCYSSFFPACRESLFVMQGLHVFFMDGVVCRQKGIA
jgi:hypothetical protein